ncbi:MAG: hypothetical protein MI861_26290, partial [Pirellulales bacterium]|nr:hypothetical protein [Pirellulales bacterium]
MLHRTTHYLTALIFLAASSVIYENVIARWMQSPEVTAIGGKRDSGMVTGPALADLFPADAWQLSGCKQLQSSNGVLLFSSWQQISDNQWKLWPVTVVVGRGISADPTTDPVIIDAPQGAEITFTESLDVMSGGAPPIHRGRMIGEVQIRRPDHKAAGQDLEIRTSNVGIDSRKIWTTESIQMNFGAARLKGRDLTVHFSGPASAGDNGEAVLDRMELIYLDEFIMPLEKGDLFQSRTQQPAQVSIQSSGRVEYDFAIDELSLTNSVRLVHQIAGELPDQFLCQSLTLKLLDPMNDSIQR